MVICGYLNSNVAFDVIYKASDLNIMIKIPTSLICFFIGYLFEEEDTTWTPDYQSLSIDQDHLPQILIGNRFMPVLREILRIYYKDLPLSIERVNLIFISIIETLLRKVL